MCLGDFLSMRTLCDAYHKEFESHYCSILDISAHFAKNHYKTMSKHDVAIHVQLYVSMPFFESCQ